MTKSTTAKFGLFLFLAPTFLLASDCNFDCTLKKHLDAIQNRNFEQFSETITDDQKLSFILPNGTYVEDRDAYLNMLKGWFAQEGWHFNYEILRKDEGADMAMALLLVSYDEDDRNGKPYHIDHYLSLVFQKQNQEWRMIHDQNTQTHLTPKEK